MIWPELAESVPLPAVPDWSRGTELHAAKVAAMAAIVKLLAMRELI
jgi:hypothetical protein